MLILDSDYATWTNLQQNISSNAMVCDYKMVRINPNHHTYEDLADLMSDRSTLTTIFQY